MSSSICQNFTQNAWKKDLCSNCFKSKDEHKQQTSYSSTFKLPAQFTTNAKLSSSNSGQVSRSENEYTKKTDYPNKNKSPTKGIMKKSMLKTSKSTSAKSKSHKVSFPKNVYEIIGYGGDWSDNDSNDEDHDFMNIDGNERDENAATSTDDEETLELKRITRANTDFNMSNGNLLGDPEENIKKSFAALKLGAPQVDKEGKKQTLKISVVPFGAAAGAESAKQASSAATTVKAKFETKAELVTTTKQSTSLKSAQKNGSTTITETVLTKSATSKTSASSTSKSDASFTSDNDGKSSPPIMRAMEKSLLDEISETLEQKQNESKKLAAEASQSNNSTTGKIKFEITSLSDTLESKQTFLELKKPIARNAPITKEHAKPRVNVFHKYSDSDSNCSDAENGVSAYYDVVETQISYENLPDGKCNPPDKSPTAGGSASSEVQSQPDNKSVYSSSQYITDMLLSSKTRAASYNLHEGNFMTSKITSDGLIVTKCSSDDALDSTGSSFDGSSDEETSYNMIRCESDSGIGISIGSDYKNVQLEKGQERQRARNKLSGSTNNSDYEDIQVVDQANKTKQAQSSAKSTTFSLEKRRELHGEPDGSADPDGSLENKEPNVQQLPALPKSPPPTKIIDARTSFLHGLQKGQTPILTKKPELPAKPVVATINSPLKNFISKRQANSAEQQVINQLQLVMSKSSENLAADAAKDADAKLRKGRAPGPPPEQKSSAPPTPERDYNMSIEFETHTSNANSDGGAIATAAQSSNTQHTTSGPVEVKPSTDTGNKPEAVEIIATKLTTTTTAAAAPNPSSLYTRKLPAATAIANGSAASKVSSSPVIREKDKRERATVNPKFRSLNTFATQRNNVAKQLQFQAGSSPHNLKQTMTPEPTPRNHKNLSMSQECLPSALPTSSTTISASSLNLTTTPTGDKKSSAQSTPPQKTKTKFSIKKFLRMGASSKTSGDSLHHKNKDNIYSEICTGEETGVTGKPRLVIIHPIDINPTAVEVVKDITKTSDAVKAQTVAVVTPAKPPPPPMRALERQRVNELNKPARPPPPKSAELRRKQQQQGGDSSLMAAATVAEDPGASAKCNKATDNVYANLGEIRLSIAPRKPERTASMREREAQLELARKRHIGGAGEKGGRSNQNTDTISICSSNADNVSTIEPHSSTNISSDNNNASNKGSNVTQNLHLTVVDGNGSGKPPIGSRTSTFERTKKEPKAGIVSKLEIFENRNSNSSGGSRPTSAEGRPSSLKDSVRKINSTIDSYLKDKRDYENMYDFVKAASTPPPPPARSTVDLLGGGQRQQQAARRNNLYSDTTSITSYTRSEYGPVRHYGLNNSLANIPRVISASYCGSEMSEFDIYAPYSYYGSEAGGDVASDINDSVWGVPSAIKNRTKATNRLRMRKGRSVVHKTIEDNYTAVVVANHEALAQVLDQLQQTPVIPPALRPLANAINLRFEDFTMIEGNQAFVVGKKAFHAAVWTMAPVTLALSADCNQLSGVGGELSQLSGGVSGVLNPITEFCDLVPSYHLPLMPSTEMVLLQATISVLPRLQLDTLQSIGAILKGKSQVLDKSNFNFRGSIPNLAAGGKDSLSAIAGTVLRNVVSVQNLSTLNEESSTASLDNVNPPTAVEAPLAAGMPAYDDVMTREVAFIVLQLVNGMKNLQVKAIEEMPLSLSNVVLSKDVENKDAQARLCVLQGNNNDEDEPMGTLCKCAHIALTEMLPLTKITPILADILSQERAESLSKAKSVLEFVLWGPSDVVLSGSTKERELALQRWLDLERATVLHGLVRTRVELTVYDECHLMFLVRSNAKMMNDAAKIVCSFQQQQQKPLTEVAQKD